MSLAANEAPAPADGSRLSGTIAQVVFGILMGPLGVMLATPLAAAMLMGGLAAVGAADAAAA